MTDYARNISGNKYEFRKRLWTIEHLLKEAIIINRYLINVSNRLNSTEWKFDTVLCNIVQRSVNTSKSAVDSSWLDLSTIFTILQRLVNVSFPPRGEIFPLWNSSHGGAASRRFVGFNVDYDVYSGT